MELFPMFRKKNWKNADFSPSGAKTGSGGEIHRKIFLPKHAPDPKVSFGEIKFHVPWNFFPCSGRKTAILDIFGPKGGAGVKFTEKFFLPKHAPDPKVSFGEIKIHVPGNFFPCSGQKTCFLDNKS